MRTIDLTRPLDPGMRDRIPEPARAATQVIAPVVGPVEWATDGAEQRGMAFGCAVDDLPDGEGWGEERLRRVAAGRPWSGPTPPARLPAGGRR